MSSSLSRQLFSPALRLALLVAGAAPMAQAQRVARPDAAKSSGVAVWLTTADKAVLFQPQAGQLKLGAGTNAHPTIEIDEARTYQTIDGFGYCLTGDTAQQKIFMIVGPRRSGKGTIARILRALVGIFLPYRPTSGSKLTPPADGEDLKLAVVMDDTEKPITKDC